MGAYGGLVGEEKWALTDSPVFPRVSLKNGRLPVAYGPSARAHVDGESLFHPCAAKFSRLLGCVLV